MSAAEPTPTPEPTASPEPTPTPAAEPTPEPTPAPSWRDGFSDEVVRDHPSLATFENPEALSKSYIEQGKLIGKKGLIPPDENSSPEDVAKFYQELGAPETAEGYEMDKFVPPEILGEVWDSDGVNVVAKKAAELGVSTAQFQGLVNALAEHQAGTIGEQVGAIQENRKSADEALTEAWGPAKTEKMEFAKRGLATFAASLKMDPDAVAGHILPNGKMLGDDYILSQLFAEIGEGGDLGFAGGKGGRVGMTPEEIGAELAEINVNPGLYQQGHHEHKQLVARRLALNKMLSPDEGAE